MITLRQALPISKPHFSIFPIKTPIVQNGSNLLPLCKKLDVTCRDMASMANSEASVLLLPLKKLNKRKGLGFKVTTSALKSDFRVIGERDVTTRRAIAIKRVLEDNGNGSVRDYFLFKTARGDQLFVQTWTPESGEIKGLVVLLHGLNEHCGRYSDFAKQLNANGYKVFGMDWIGAFIVDGYPQRPVECVRVLTILLQERRMEAVEESRYRGTSGVSGSTGHGGSDGLHAYVPSLDYAVSDMKAFVEKVSAENPGLPCYGFGHSTGAAIVLKVIMDPAMEALMKGVVLTSPAVRVKPSHPIFWVIAPIFAFLLPKYQFSSATKKGLPVSRDQDALIAKYSDPLVYIGAIRVRTGSEILRLSSFLQQNLSKLTVPFLVLHGTADTVTDPKASQKLYEEASSTDKSIKLYDGYLHDLLFEPERKSIAEDIIKWLNSR